MPDVLRKLSLQLAIPYLNPGQKIYKLAVTNIINLQYLADVLLNNIICGDYKYFGAIIFKYIYNIKKLKYYNS